MKVSENLKSILKKKRNFCPSNAGQSFTSHFVIHPHLGAICLTNEWQNKDGASQRQSRVIKEELLRGTGERKLSRATICVLKKTETDRKFFPFCYIFHQISANVSMDSGSILTTKIAYIFLADQKYDLYH